MSKLSRPTPRPPVSRADRKQETRRRLVEAASALFASKGYDATSTREIARRARVAAGTVFLHAPDKEELLFLVMHDRLAQAIDHAFTSLPPKLPLVDQLMHVFGDIYALYGSMPSVARPFVAATPGARGPNAQAVSALTFAFLGRLGALVQAAQGRGEVAADVDAFLLAQNLFALYVASLFSWIAGYATVEAALDPGLRRALELQLRGLGRKR